MQVVGYGHARPSTPDVVLLSAAPARPSGAPARHLQTARPPPEPEEDDVQVVGYGRAHPDNIILPSLRYCHVPRGEELEEGVVFAGESCAPSATPDVALHPAAPKPQARNAGVTALPSGAPWVYRPPQVQRGRPGPVRGPTRPVGPPFFSSPPAQRPPARAAAVPARWAPPALLPWGWGWNQYAVWLDERWIEKWGWGSWAGLP